MVHFLHPFGRIAPCEPPRTLNRTKMQPSTENCSHGEHQAVGHHVDELLALTRCGMEHHTQATLQIALKLRTIITSKLNDTEVFMGLEFFSRERSMGTPLWTRWRTSTRALRRWRVRKGGRDARQVPERADRLLQRRLHEPDPHHVHDAVR